MTAYYRTAAYKSAVAHPFTVYAFEDWRSDPSVVVGFQSEDDARAFASLRPEPLIDLAQRDVGLLGIRRLLQHPATVEYGDPFAPRDDFPDTRP